MVRFRALLAGIAITVSGCATLSGFRQPVFIDSQPAGLKLVDEKGRGVVTTPAGTVIGRTRQLRLRVVDEERVVASFRTRCKYRWLISGVLNVPVVGQLLDLATGAAWDCPGYIKLTLPDDKSLRNAPSREDCRRTAVHVIGVSDLGEQKKITDFWAKKFSSGCHSVVDHGSQYSALTRFGIDAQTDPDNWTADSLLKFSAETGSNQVYVLKLVNPKNSSRTAEFEARMLTFSQLVARQQAISERPLPEPKKIRMRLSTPVDEASSWLSSSFRMRNILTLLPNTIGVSLAVTRMNLEKDADDNAEYELDSSSNLGLGVSLRSVDHRDQFYPWDFSLRFRPDLFGFWGNEKVSILRRRSGSPTGSETSSLDFYDAQYASFGFLYGMIFSIYTPAFIAFTSLSLGPVWTYLSLADASGIAMALGGQFKMGLAQFVYSDLYAFLEVGASFGSAEIASVRHRGTSSASLGLSWYFGAWAL